MHNYNFSIGKSIESPSTVYGAVVFCLAELEYSTGSPIQQYLYSIDEVPLSNEIGKLGDAASYFGVKHGADAIYKNAVVGPVILTGNQIFLHKDTTCWDQGKDAYSILRNDIEYMKKLHPEKLIGYLDDQIRGKRWKEAISYKFSKIKRWGGLTVVTDIWIDSIV